MNDSAQRIYNWTTLRPYLNMALMELLQVMEENGLPTVQGGMTPSITVPAGDTEIAYQGTTAQLPADLVEPEQLWESNDGGNSWAPMVLRQVIDPNIATGQNLIFFGIYVWLGDKIQVPSCTSDNLIKIKYIRNLVPLPLNTSQETFPLPLRTPLFLGHKTAALCAALTAQDETRAEELNTLAETALSREINIPVKTLQRNPVRRRPFRSSYKLAGRVG